jgi:CBS-domain-containing membrane protein
VLVEKGLREFLRGLPVVVGDVQVEPQPRIPAGVLARALILDPHEAHAETVDAQRRVRTPLVVKPVSVLVGTSVRDVAILLLEKRISAVPVLAANLQLLGMVSEGDLIGDVTLDIAPHKE